ncbi:MAG: hypothetical protein RIT16_598, partial [Actinomycetota bacterium]
GIAIGPSGKRSPDAISVNSAMGKHYALFVAQKYGVSYPSAVALVLLRS